MVNCNHIECQGKSICGQLDSNGIKNPGGNIFTPGQVSKHKTYQVLGWHSPDESKVYNDLVNKLNNGIIVEIGVYGGASLLGVIDTCIKTNSHIYGIDPWEKIETGNGANFFPGQKSIYRESIKKIRLDLENIIRCEKYNKNITLIHDFSKNMVDKFKNLSVDVVFIDGDHSYDSVYEDLLLWFPKVKIGGTIWGDDFSWKSVRLAVIDFANKNKIKFEIICNKQAWYFKK